MVESSTISQKLVAHRRAKRTTPDGEKPAADLEAIAKSKALVKRYQKSLVDPDRGDEDLADQVVKHFEKLIFSIADYFKTFPIVGNGVDPDDLIAAGNLGLVSGLAKYDEDQNTTPSTFLSNSILYAMADELYANTSAEFKRCFKRVVQLHKMKRMAIELVQNAKDTGTSNAALAKLVGVEASDLDKLDTLYNGARSGAVSIFEDYDGNDGYADSIAAADADENCIRANTDKAKAAIATTVDQLRRDKEITADQKRLLEMRLGLSAEFPNAMTYEEMAEHYECSSTALQAKVDKLIKKVEAALEPNKFTVEKDYQLKYGIKDFFALVKKIYADYLEQNEAWEQFSTALGGFLQDRNLSYNEFSEIFLKRLSRTEFDGGSVITLEDAENLQNALEASQSKTVPKAIREWFNQLSSLDTTQNTPADVVNDLNPVLDDFKIFFRIMYRDYQEKNKQWLYFARRLPEWKDAKVNDLDSFFRELIRNFRKSDRKPHQPSSHRLRAQIPALSLEERQTIEAMLRHKLDVKQIAAALGRDVKIIRLEIRDNESPYNPEKAQARHEEKSRTIGIAEQPELAAYIDKQLEQGLTPEEIVRNGLLEDNPLSVTANEIYQYICAPANRDKGFLELVFPDIRKLSQERLSNTNINSISSSMNEIVASDRTVNRKKRANTLQSLKPAFGKLSELYSYKGSGKEIAPIAILNLSDFMGKLYLHYKAQTDSWIRISESMGHFLHNKKIALLDFVSLLLQRMRNTRVRANTTLNRIAGVKATRTIGRFLLRDKNKVAKLSDVANSLDRQAESVTSQLSRTATRFYDIYSKIRNGEITEPATLITKATAREAFKAKQPSSPFPNFALMQRQFEKFFAMTN